MERYHLAKLVEWAGTLNTRKRMQKVVYLLQAAGCRIHARFVLHHYGPYSFEVARLADEMVAAGLLDESEDPNPLIGRSFSYCLSVKGRTWIRNLEHSAIGKRLARDVANWKEQAGELLGRDVRELEVAATIIAFKRRPRGWEDALERACRFKRLNPQDALAKSALELARETV